MAFYSEKEVGKLLGNDSIQFLLSISDNMWKKDNTKKHHKNILPAEASSTTSFCVGGDLAYFNKKKQGTNNKRSFEQVIKHLRTKSEAEFLNDTEKN